MAAFVIMGFLLVLTCGAACAEQQGQVITPEIREWAKKIVLDEQRLGATVETNTLMVLYYRNNSGNATLDPLQKGLALMLITDLSQVKELQLVERVKLQALLDELAMGTTSVVATESAPRAGKLVGARWVVGGDLAALTAEGLEVTSRLVDIPTTMIVGQPTSKGVLEEFLQMEKEIVFDIVKLLHISLTPEAEATLGKPFSTSIKAVTALAVAVDASDHGDYIKAADLYEKALREDPAIPIAVAALKELKELGMLDGWKREHGLPPVGIKKADQASKSADTPSKNVAPVSNITSSVPSLSTDTTSKNVDLLSTVSNATSQTRIQAAPISSSVTGTQESPIISNPISTPAVINIISVSPVTITPIFPSPTDSAKSTLSSVNSMLKSIAPTNTRK